MIKPDFQRIADSFSIGKVTSSQIIKEPIRLKEKRKNPLTESFENVSGLLSLFHLQTNHGSYILVGVSPNVISEKRLEKKIKSELDLTYFEYLPTHDKTLVTHKNSLWWYLIQPFKLITKAAATKKILAHIKNQKMYIQIGYGGTLFVGIGKPIEPEITWASGDPYRDMEFYVDEWWEIWHKGKKVASRFEDELADEFVEKINGRKITDFRIQPSFKRTFISLGDYDLVIYRTEELTTWDFRHRMESFKITLTGRKKLQIKDYIFERPGQTTKKHKSFQPTIFDQFYKEYLPISLNNVKKLIKPLHGYQVKEVREYSGISFGLSLGEDQEWLVSLNGEWELTKRKKPILSSTSHRFVFINQLKKLLLKTKLKAINFDSKQTCFVFDNDIKITVFLKKKRSIWTIFNHQQEFHISAYKDGSFAHTIICPEELREQYLEPQYGSALASNLYALDFYRKLIE